jgi:hypothetical protein
MPLLCNISQKKASSYQQGHMKNRNIPQINSAKCFYVECAESLKKITTLSSTLMIKKEQPL